MVHWKRQIIGSIQQRCREEGRLGAVSKYLPCDRFMPCVEVWCPARARREDKARWWKASCHEAWKSHRGASSLLKRALHGEMIDQNPRRL